LISRKTLSTTAEKINAESFLFSLCVES